MARKKDPMTAMRELLFQALQPKSRLYEYAWKELVEGGEGDKPDVKLLKELLSVMRELTEMEQGRLPRELVVRFEEDDFAE